MDVCTAMDASGLDTAENSFWYKSSNEEELMSVIERTMMGIILMMMEYMGMYY